MKLNRKRIDARFPNWLLEWIFSVRIKYDWTFTECLIRCAEKGLAYYEKQWTKMHPQKNEKKGSSLPNEDPAGKGCSEPDQEDSTPEEEVTDEQVDEMMKDLFPDDETTKKKI